MSSEDESQRVLSVSELTARIKETLQAAFPAIWVSGEVSDLARPQSGHLYFSLKDNAAQIRCVIWRSTAARLSFDLQDGQQVVCRGELDVYPPRGGYQLIVRRIEIQGVGALQMALRRLQRRLAAEGLFDASRKRALPRLPRRIALVTSPTGAAVRDFLEVIRRRAPSVDVLVVPSRVQGEGAASEIVRAVRTANRLAPAPDVLVLARGGGSLEDLWCFNEESVVRAIVASRAPVISAVGHEIDVTLSDLAADVRALTPTEAAELAAPSRDELATGLRMLDRRLSAALRARAAQARARLESVARRRALRRPLERVRESMRRLDELEMRSRRAARRGMSQAADRIAVLAGRLNSLSPLAVLARGYSLTFRAADGRLVTRADQVAPGQRIMTRLVRDGIASRVEAVQREAPPDGPPRSSSMKKKE